MKDQFAVFMFHANCEASGGWSDFVSVHESIDEAISACEARFHGDDNCPECLEIVDLESLSVVKEGWAQKLWLTGGLTEKLSWFLRAGQHFETEKEIMRVKP